MDYVLEAEASNLLNQAKAIGFDDPTAALGILTTLDGDYRGTSAQAASAALRERLEGRDTPPAQSQNVNLATLWPDVRQSDDIAVVEAFLVAAADNPLYSGLARNLLNTLNDPQTQDPPSPQRRTDVESKALTAGRIIQDRSDFPEMVVIPAGSFMLGSPRAEEGRSINEGPQQRVTIAQPFALGKYEVTFEQWEACVRSGGCRSNRNPHDEGWGRGSRPVINVSWNDAQKYVSWLNSQVSGNPYRLPSESEWEYAARAGTTTAYNTGSNISSTQANFGYKIGKTAAVGSYGSNQFGLHDMHGNVWEWTSNCNTASHAESARQNCEFRGGSWFNDPLLLRSAGRSGGNPSNRFNSIWFRVLRDL